MPVLLAVPAIYAVRDDDQQHHHAQALNTLTFTFDAAASRE
jgi:hypothetical protein